jgi:outer membrane receptor for ferrienterochelin and colicins
MLRYILLVFMCAYSVSVFAQRTITGRILAEGIPVKNATVKLLPVGNSTLTNDSGRYTLAVPEKKIYRLQVSANGYSTVEWDVDRTATQPIFSDMNIQRLSMLADEVVISGTMKEVTRSKSVVPVEIYRASFFRKTAVTGLFESMQMVNGIVPVISCNVCNTGSFSINGLDGPYTMVMIDGMPIVSALSTVYSLNAIPNSMIDRIEVVKGPASTLYGSEAVAGLINIVTVKPDKAPRISVDMFATTYNEWNTDLAFAYRTKHYSTLFSMNILTMPTPWDKNNDGFTDVSLQQRISMFNKWQFIRKSGKQHSLALRYVFEDRWGGDTRWNKNFRGGDSIYGESIYTHRTELIGQYDLPRLSNVKLMYSYNLHHQNSVYGVTPYTALQQVGFTQLYWNKTINSHDLTAGIAGRYTYYDDNTPATRSSDTLSAQNRPVQTLLPGIFVQNEWKINLRHQLLLGARLDYYRAHGVVFSPRVNYRWRLNDNNNIRISAGNGFRVVNIFTEEHAALTGARRVEIRGTLNPEQSYNINAHYTRYISFKNGYMNIELSPFYTYFTNRIVADYDTDPDAIIYDNLNGHAISRGISISADAVWSNGIRFNAGATALDVFRVDKLADGSLERSRLVYAPEWMATCQLTIPYRPYDLTLDYTAQAYGPMRMPVFPDDFRPAYSPVYSLHNVQLTKLFHSGLSLYGGVRNLFNFLPVSPIMRPFDPFDRNVNDAVRNPNGYTFDAAYNYAPVMGMRFFAGIRYILK